MGASPPSGGSAGTRLLKAVGRVEQQVATVRGRAWRFRALVDAAKEGTHITIGHGVRFEQSVRVQGRGRVALGDFVALGYRLSGSVRMPILLQPRDPGAEIRIASRTMLSNGVEIMARTAVVIGAGCRIGPGCLLMDADFHGVAAELRDTAGLTAPVMVEDNVWMGARSVILKGCHIGAGAVVAAGSVVTADVPDGACVGGVPARVIGTTTRT